MKERIPQLIYSALLLGVAWAFAGCITAPSSQTEPLREKLLALEKLALRNQSAQVTALRAKAYDQLTYLPPVDVTLPDPDLYESLDVITVPSAPTPSSSE